MEDDDLYHFPVGRLKDNRLQGLLREMTEAIKQEDDPEVLRKLGQSLKLLGDVSRSRGYGLQRKSGNRFW